MLSYNSGRKNPKILIVTPEITYLPDGMGNMSNRLKAKAGGLADVSASLVAALYKQGADVHVALPHYRRMFNIDVGKLINSELRVYVSRLSNSRIHLAEDRVFYYRNSVYSNYAVDSFKQALAFQREVINNIIPRVNPDLIHCNDWMTGLIPAHARRLGIPCLFTVHNIHTQKMTLEQIEDRGIDAAEFWNYLYYDRPPFNYEESRSNNRVDLLCSGIFAAHFINTVSPTFLNEICDGRHDFVPDNIRQEIMAKKAAGCASGILNAPDDSYDPATDPDVECNYTAANVWDGKRKNKVEFQRKTGLDVDPEAPIFYWPSRLDPIQKGCQLLAEIMYDVIHQYWADGLQIAIVANGSFQYWFHEIARFHDISNRVAVVDFDDNLSHHGYAAADFMLIPSRFEPCGLPQMISPIYGTLSIATNTGGLHDTVHPLDLGNNTGNGFVFNDYDANALHWAINQAMTFYRNPRAVREPVLQRIMTEAKKMFNHEVTAKHYIEIYETMLQRPLVR
ncbi:MAG: glycogen/starch synthase [Victivallales bacterium]|nr:glycogen/starch synthase [Victivallales bacterium]